MHGTSLISAFSSLIDAKRAIASGYAFNSGLWWKSPYFYMGKG